MRALIVYDSVYGNTEKIALAMGDALGQRDETKTCRVGDVRHEQLKDLDLLIVGSPTRAFRPTKDVAGFLKGMPANSLNGVKIAAFDTRIAVDDVRNRLLHFMVKLFGYAAKPIADTLVNKGGTPAAAPEGFFVRDSEGPLKDGEIERAAAWAQTVASNLGIPG